MENFIVVYDACVLYPAPLRDLLMNLALSDLFKAKWTEDIHREWIENLLINRTDLSREKLMETRKKMDAAVPDCLISGYKPIIATLNLPDSDDNHVLAAAIKANADTIITLNLRDFPRENLKPYGIEAVHPDQFAKALIEEHSGIVLSILKEARMVFKRPPLTAGEYIGTLSKQPLPLTIKLLHEYSALI